MNNEVKLWLAGELGYRYDVNPYDVDDILYNDGTPEGLRGKRFDIESDTPDAAYLRENALKMLVSKYEFGWRACNGLMLCELRYALGDRFYNFKTWDLDKAIVTAWQWLYDRRDA